jgi:hypothetical protein
MEAGEAPGGCFLVLEKAAVHFFVSVLCAESVLKPPSASLCAESFAAVLAGLP